MLTLLEPSRALGQASPKVCDPEDSQACSQPLQEGEVAPFTGQLLTPRLAVNLGQKATGCDWRVQLERDYVDRMAVVDRDLLLKKVHLEMETYQNELKLYRDEINRINKTPWYQRPIILVVGTFLASGLVFSGILFLGK